MLSFSRNVIDKRAFYVNGLYLHSHSVLFQEGLAAQNNHSRCFFPAPDGRGWRRDQKKTWIKAIGVGLYIYFLCKINDVAIAFLELVESQL